MFDKMRMLFWRFLIVVVILFAHGNVMAEEVGKTPEGNVIYRFKCPGVFPINAKLTLNWPNHLSDHPQWKIDGPGSYEGGRSAGGQILAGPKRDGQVLLCDYERKIEGISYFPGRLTYKYRVQRAIISCKTVAYWTLECILKP